MRKSMVVGAIMALVACGRSSVTTPLVPIPPANFAGTWSGPISTGASGNGTISLKLTQQGLVLLPPGVGLQYAMNGTWSTSFPNAAYNDSGTVQGTGWSASVSVAFKLSDAGTCALTLTGTRTGTPSMSGTLGASGCVRADSGGFVVSKQ
jgi:hypothetical protein